MLTVSCPNEEFNAGYRWALVRADQFFQETPAIGTTMVAGFGTTDRIDRHLPFACLCELGTRSSTARLDCRAFTDGQGVAIVGRRTGAPRIRTRQHDGHRRLCRPDGRALFDALRRARRRDRVPRRAAEDIPPGTATHPGRTSAAARPIPQRGHRHAAL